jgi:hypothetical protein
MKESVTSLEAIMVKITEKRTEKIKPTKIDNDLLFRLGGILNSECADNQKVFVTINADCKDIECENHLELKDIEIPADTYFVHMGVTPEDEDLSWENPIDISIDMKFPIKNSKISVRGNKEALVRGISATIVKELNRKKLMHRYFAQYSFLRLATSIGSSVLLMTVLGLALLRFSINPSYVSLFLAALFYVVVVLLNHFFTWVFPYFEIDNDDFKPRKFRKAALGLLWGSGFLGIVIEIALKSLGIG